MRRLGLILYLIPVTVFAQQTIGVTKISNSTMLTVKKLEAARDVGLESWEQEFRISAIPIRYGHTQVTIEEMKLLSSHENPIVRSYAFKALAELSETEAFEVVKQHLNDSILINTAFGCFRETETVGDAFVSIYHAALNNYVSAHMEHRRILDSLIVITPNRLKCRGEAAQRLGTIDAYYSRVRELALNDGIFKAIVALARYRKDEDVEQLLNAKIKDRPFRSQSLSARLYVVEQFPHEGFLPFLEQHLDRELSGAPSYISRYVYRALSNFDGKHAHRLLTRPFEIPNPAIRMQHLEILMSVLKNNTNPELTELRKKLVAEKFN
jgi:hypothetical protein